MPATKGKKSIVILENEEQYSRVVAMKLSIEGFEVKSIPTVKEFWAEIKKSQPDLVLLDLMLEDETGFDVLEKMKSDPKLKKIKVIVYSSLAQEDDKQKAKKLGVADYLVKSEVTLKEMVAKVKEII